MRNHYYDNVPWKWEKDGEKKAEPGGKVQPEAPAVPQPLPAQTEPVSAPETGQQVLARQEVPVVETGARPEPPAAPQPAQPILTPPPGRREAREKRPSGFGRFLIFFLLLAGLLAGSAYLRHTHADAREPFWEDFDWRQLLPWDRWAPDEGDSGDWWYEEDWFWEDRDWTAQLAQTEIQRAPTGGSFDLELKEPAEETMAAPQIYEKVAPSIVGIRAYGSTGTSLGTGIILTADGYIVTNCHVIAGGVEAQVVFSNDRILQALLVGYDAETDLAVLKIDATDLPAAEFGDSELLRVGETAYAIGNPLGEELRSTMTDGIISAVDRAVDSYNGTMYLIQTSAALNSGNSGGALVNAWGQVVGITNMKMMDVDETIEGLGFAIPSTQVREVTAQLIRQGEYAGRPMLGITVTNHFDREGRSDGVEITAVAAGSDAQEKGIGPGERVIRANGAQVYVIQDLLDAKKGLQVGDALVLTLVGRDGSEREVTIVMWSGRAMEQDD